MILSCNFEEVTALIHGARSYLEDGPVTGYAVTSTTALREAVERVVLGIDGDVSVNTLREQEELESGLGAVVEHLHATLESSVLALHPAAEEAVSAYFDYAHALAVLGRVRVMGSEMRALLELVGGAEPAGSFWFPD